jgi:hypothetical protein
MVGIDSTRRTDMKLTLMAAALLAAIVATPASAIPAGSGPGINGAATVLDPVAQVYGGHRSCEWGPIRGWHRHVGWRAFPVACAPAAAQPFRCWRDYFGIRHCRW